MSLLLDRLLLELIVQYGVVARLTDVIHLDSSSDTKFSRHIVLRLPDTVFVDNEAVGGFVRHLVDAVVAEAATDEDMRRVMCWTRAPPAATDSNINVSLNLNDALPAPPIDCAVYTKHRSFRLLWSSKRKPNAPVLHCHHSQQYSRASTQRAVWMHSCVQYMECSHRQQHCTQLTWPPQSVHGNPSDISSSGSSGGGRLPAVRVSSPVARPLAEQCPCSSTSSSASSAASLCALRSLVDAAALGAIERFISDTWPAQPSVASLTLRSHSGAVSGGGESCRVTLLYSVTGSRYCERVSRPHRSNGIYFVAHMRLARSADGGQQGQSTCEIVQRCHDVDCKGFSSQHFPVPASIMTRMTVERSER